MNGRIKAYLYSAVSSTFLFVMMREIGFIGRQNAVQFGDQPTRIFGASIIGGTNSKFLKDAIISRGVKSKKILNKAMVNINTKSSSNVRSKARSSSSRNAVPDDEIPSKERHLRRQPRNAHGGRTSSREHDSDREERDEMESDENGEVDRHPADRRSKSYSTTSSRRDSMERIKSTSRRDRDNYQEKESRQDQSYEDTGSVEQQMEGFDHPEGGDSSSSRRRSNARTLTSGGNDVDAEVEEDYQTKKHKRQPAYDGDNTNGVVRDTSARREVSNYKNDAEGDYDTDKENVVGRHVGGSGGESSSRSRTSESASVTDTEVATDASYASTNKNLVHSKTKPIDGDNNNEEGGYDAASDGEGANRRGKPKVRLPPLATNDGIAAINSKSSPADPQSQPEAKQEGPIAGRDEIRQELSSSSKKFPTHSDASESSSLAGGKGYDQDSTEPASLATSDESSSLGQQPAKKVASLLHMEKPPIYTFFTGVQDRTANTGMTDDADDQLLQTWKEEWSNAGWNPVILSLETAKQHPDFDAVDALLDGPFGEYDRYCFLRWLAVAVVGGGFAVDYDTLPFNFVMNTLPNGGRVTVHENSDVGGVPSLVSASAEEYTKFAWALAKNLGLHKAEEHWSDMKAMQDIYKKTNGQAYIMESNVMSALEVLNGRGYDPYNCGIVEGKYAIHFSHHSIKFGKLWDGVGPQDRPTIGKEWLKGWRKSCKWRISSELS